MPAIARYQQAQIAGMARSYGFDFFVGSHCTLKDSLSA